MFLFWALLFLFCPLLFLSCDGLFALAGLLVVLLFCWLFEFDFFCLFVWLLFDCLLLFPFCCLLLPPRFVDWVLVLEFVVDLRCLLLDFWFDCRLERIRSLPAWLLIRTFISLFTGLLLSLAALSFLLRLRLSNDRSCLTAFWTLKLSGFITFWSISPRSRSRCWSPVKK